MYSSRVFVCELSSKITSGDLKTYFKRYGSVTKSDVIYDDMGHSKCFGFVEFKHELCAKKACLQERQMIKTSNAKVTLKNARLEVPPRRPLPSPIISKPHFVKLQEEETEIIPISPIQQHDSKDHEWILLTGFYIKKMEVELAACDDEHAKAMDMMDIKCSLMNTAADFSELDSKDYISVVLSKAMELQSSVKALEALTESKKRSIRLVADMEINSILGN